MVEYVQNKRIYENTLNITARSHNLHHHVLRLVDDWKQSLTMPALFRLLYKQSQHCCWSPYQRPSALWRSTSSTRPWRPWRWLAGRRESYGWMKWVDLHSRSSSRSLHALSLLPLSNGLEASLFVSFVIRYLQAVFALEIK